MKRLVLMPFVAVLLASCQDYLFDQKFPQEVEEVAITVPEVRPTPADIIFIVDNSGSMADEQEVLAASFDSFAKVITQSDGDYRIGVITTDTDGPKGLPGRTGSFSGEIAGLSSTAFTAASPFDATGIDFSGCQPTDLAHSCFHAPLVDSTQSRADQLQNFANVIKVGSCGSGTERGIESLIAALGKTAPGGCNADFLRENSNLVLIFVTDEDDSSRDMATSGTPPLLPPRTLELLEQYKPLSKIRIAMIVGAGPDGKAARCRVGNKGKTDLNCGHSICEACPGNPNDPAWCATETARKEWNLCWWCSYYNDTTNCCEAVAGSSFVNLATELEKRVAAQNPAIEVTGCQTSTTSRTACLIESICQSNFGDSLARIATELVIDSRMELSPAPVNPKGVAVSIHGGRYPEGRKLKYGTDFTISTVSPELAYLDLKVLPEPPNERLEVKFVSRVVNNSPKDDAGEPPTDAGP